jgi:hypothetical protein
VRGSLQKADHPSKPHRKKRGSLSEIGYLAEPDPIFAL